MKITVIYSPVARQCRQWHLTVPSGSNVKQALLACGVMSEFSGLCLETLLLGVWRKTCNLEQLLKEHDRIEIYRPLSVDPKVARRERFVRQGVKSAGLFANKRAGAKAGYGG